MSTLLCLVVAERRIAKDALDAYEALCLRMADRVVFSDLRRGFLETAVAARRLRGLLTEPTFSNAELTLLVLALRAHRAALRQLIRRDAPEVERDLVRGVIAEIDDLHRKVRPDLQVPA